jgi:hypothetical protein
LKYIDKDQQVLFTTTDLDLFAPEFTEQADIWDVQNGVINVRRKEK